MRSGEPTWLPHYFVMLRPRLYFLMKALAQKEDFRGCTSDIALPRSQLTERHEAHARLGVELSKQIHIVHRFGVEQREVASVLLHIIHVDHVQRQQD